MRILQINTVYDFGSTGRIVADLNSEIIKLGNESFVAFGQKTANYNLSFKVGSNIENHLHNVGSRLFDKQGFFTKNGTRKLIRFIENIKPDIIHLHNLHGNYINIQILFEYLRKANIPIIWTLHDCWSFTGHCAYFDFLNCNKWQTECNNCPGYKSYPKSHFLDCSKSNFYSKRELFSGIKDLTLVTPSFWLANLVRKSFLSEYKIEIINNGIDTKTFNIKDTNKLRDKLGLKNKIVLLGVSAEGFKGRKGLTYFIELSKSLNDLYKIILIGVTSQDLKLMPANIICVKRTDNIQQLAEYYSLADIFVNPTLEDNYPTTNLEALACGTPIITFNTGGSPEVITSQTGIVVDKNDSNGLLNAILKMNIQFKITNQLDCRKHALCKLDKSLMYSRYIQLYQNFYN